MRRCELHTLVWPNGADFDPATLHDRPLHEQMKMRRSKSESAEADWWASPAGRAQAREIAHRKGIGYQTLLKMLVREGLAREGRRR